MLVVVPDVCIGLAVIGVGLGEGVDAGLGVGEGVGVGVGEDVGEGDRLGDSKGDGLRAGDDGLVADFTEVITMEVKLTIVVAITTKIGMSAGISYIVSCFPLRCLKNSTWRSRFLASSSVL